eukprot:2269827-Rhodomonas_salina.5
MSSTEIACPVPRSHVQYWDTQCLPLRYAMSGTQIGYPTTRGRGAVPVSYTHLTLPTICSV